MADWQLVYRCLGFADTSTSASAACTTRRSFSLVYGLVRTAPTPSASISACRLSAPLRPVRPVEITIWTDGFIRRPFIYLGAWYGVAAGALALGLLAAAAYALDAPLQALAQSYGSGFALDGLDPLRAAGFLLAATVVGWLGAWLVTGHFLRQTRPTET